MGKNSGKVSEQQPRAVEGKVKEGIGRAASAGRSCRAGKGNSRRRDVARAHALGRIGRVVAESVACEVHPVSTQFIGDGQ